VVEVAPAAEEVEEDVAVIDLAAIEEEAVVVEVAVDEVGAVAEEEVVVEVIIHARSL